jgi:hypothetical protein
MSMSYEGAWKPRLSHRSLSRIGYTAAALGMLAGAATIAGMVQSVIAQAAAPPAVRVKRDYQIGGRVWPVDLNRDGITDLVSTASASGRVQVSIGRGNGTFNPPVESNVEGLVLNTGDFNGDQRPDVIAVRITSQTTEFVVLPGTASATLGASSTVAVTGRTVAENTFALSADLDGDGKRDLVLSSSDNLSVYPGHGDFTFGAPIQLAPGGAPLDGIIADLNNDGRKDLVTGNGEANTISIFINRGAFLFATSDMFTPHDVNDVTVADVDRDGRLDLLAAAGRFDTDSAHGIGSMLVFRGRGDGTFADPAEYPTAVGAMQIVVGDFNRDGVLDVATGNRSSIGTDDCSGTLKTWDSVSILAGLPNGTFAPVRNFSVGDQSLMDPRNPNVDRYRNTLSSLNTSDLNGDHATDLIASFGAILFNVPAVPNRPPTVDAGPDTVASEFGTVFRPAASDPDEDMLSYEIRDASGTLFFTYPNGCSESLFHEGDNPLTVTVTDGHGHSASDTVVYTVVVNHIGSFVAGTDVGHVGAAGSDVYDSSHNTYTVRGSGSDIWGTADEFHYVWTRFPGDFTVSARVDSIDNVNAWTKAGLMIRDTLDAGSPHASVFATPQKGVAFQRRLTQNGPSVHTPGPATTAPVWLQLQRTGDVIAAYSRKATTDPWAKIGEETIAGLAAVPFVGMAVTSHSDGRVASASFSGVVFSATPFTGHAIGTGSGSFTAEGPTITATGRGADIWGTADAFFYVAMKQQRGLTVTAEVRSISPTDAWSKAGVMIREDLTPAARHVMAVVTPGKGVAMQYRPSPGGPSVQAANVAGAAPAWVRLSLDNVTAGNFTASWSTDGFSWKVLGTVPVHFAADEFYVGLPITSHNATVSTSVVFDAVGVERP